MSDSTTTTESTTTSTTFPSAPKGAKPTTLALWPELEKAHATMLEAVGSVKAVQGSMGEFRKRATEQVLETDEGKALAAKVAELREALEEAEGELEQRTTEALAGLTKDLGPKREAAEATYKEARDDFEAALRIIAKDKTAKKALEEATIPNLPSKSGGTRKPKGEGDVKNASVTFYFVPAGEATRKPLAGTQNNFSSLAWYHAGELVGAKHGKTAATREWLKGKGVTDPDKAPWEVTLPSGKRIGLADTPHPAA